MAVWMLLYTQGKFSFIVGADETFPSCFISCCLSGTFNTSALWLKMSSRAPTECSNPLRLPPTHTEKHTQSTEESPLPSLIAPGGAVGGGAYWTLAFHSLSTGSLAARPCQGMTGPPARTSRQRYGLVATR